MRAAWQPCQDKMWHHPAHHCVQCQLPAADWLLQSQIAKAAQTPTLLTGKV